MAHVSLIASLRYCGDMELTVRRSRMRRTRRGKRIELTARDLEIFRLLAGYRYLPSTYIHAFVGGASETRFKERLGDLFHEGFLDRPERQWEMAHCQHRPVVHELGAGARRIMAEQNCIDERRTWLGTSAHRQFLHSVMICELLASFELATRQHQGFRFIPWQEIVAKAPAATRDSVAPYRFPTTPASGAVVPDALFGIEYALGVTKAFRFFALEADRGTMPVSRPNSAQTSYMAKIAAYREIISHGIHKSHLGIPNLLVLTIATNTSRVTDMIQRVEAIPGNSAAFLFQAIDASGLVAPMTQLFSDPWQRAVLPPFRIDR